MQARGAEGGGGEIVPLTGLRALAALAVLLHHFAGKLGDLFPQTSFEALRLGYLGVDIFFVLSGFILAYNYGGRIRSRGDYGRFVRYRLARIYPLHLATLLGVIAAVQGALAAGLPIAHPDHHELDHHLLLHLTLTHAWGLEEGLRYNLPSWSVSAEFFAYLLFPLAWAATCRVGRRGGVALALALACGAATVLALRTAGHDTLHVPQQHVLLRVGGEFLAGCLAFRAFSLRPGGAPLSRGLEAALLVGVVALVLSPWADPGMALGAVVLVYVLAAGSGPLVRALAWAPVAWLGRISYSIYLTHLPVLSVLRRVLPAEAFAEQGLWVRWGVVALHLAVILAVAVIGYYAIERPGRRWLRGAVEPRAGAAPAARTA